MFEALGDRLAAALMKITGRGVLRPEDVDAGLREVRLALLEADVNFRVVKEFVERVRTRITGVEISPGLTAPQTVVKAVNDELVELLGGNSEGLRYASRPGARRAHRRSEEHTSELQSHVKLVCRLPLGKKKRWRAHLTKKSCLRV